MEHVQTLKIVHSNILWHTHQLNLKSNLVVTNQVYRHFRGSTCNLKYNTRVSDQRCINRVFISNAETDKIV